MSLTRYVSTMRARRAAEHLLRGKNALTKADKQFLSELAALTDEAEKERLKKLMTTHAKQRVQTNFFLQYLYLPAIVFGTFTIFLIAAVRNTLTTEIWVGFGIGVTALIAFLVWLIATHRKPTVSSGLWAGLGVMSLLSIPAGRLPPGHPLFIVFILISLAYLVVVFVFLILWIIKKPNSFLSVLPIVLLIAFLFLFYSAFKDVKTHPADRSAWIKFGIMGAVFLAIVISVIVGDVSERTKNKRMTERAQGTISEVIEIVGKNRDGQQTRSYKLKVSYFAGREKHELTTDVDFEYIRKNFYEKLKGRPITVLYDPEKPENARLDLESGE